MDARKIISQGEKQGADEVEVFIASVISTSVDIKKDEIESAEHSTGSGVGIRVVMDKRMGFASTSNPDRIDEAITLAVKHARIGDPNEFWKSLPSAGNYPVVDGLFDSRVEDLSVEECIDLAYQMISGVKENATPVSGGFSHSVADQIIVNSNGVENSEKSSGVHAVMEAVVKGDAVSSGYEFDVSHLLDIDLFDIGLRAGELAAKSQKGINIETGSRTVLLCPLAIADILQNTLTPALSADNMQKNRSPLKGRLDEQIAHPGLNIIDDGTIPGGIGSSSSDDEGTPSQRTPVVEDGVFKSFLYDTYTACKDDVNSTGNASRGGYASTPGVYVSNLILEHDTVCDLISETKEAILITSVIGAHTANPASGDFSLEGRNAFLVEDGEISKPIKSVMLSGNIFDLIGKIDAVGEDIRKVGSIITPTVRAEDMTIVG